MTFVVTQNCIRCQYQDCVEVCPVDCFHVTPLMLVIDPDECIDCTLCEPECPSEAIHSEEDLPLGQEMFLQINADYAKSFPVINEKKQAPKDADQWKNLPNKIALLGRETDDPASELRKYSELKAAASIDDATWSRVMADQDILARSILVSRDDMRAHPERMHRAVHDPDTTIRIIALQHGSALAASDYDCLVKDSVSGVRLSVIEHHLNHVGPGHVAALLQDPEEQLRIRVIRNERFIPTEHQFVAAMTHGTASEAHAMTTRLTPKIAAALLDHPLGTLRAAAYGLEALDLDMDRIEKGLCDPDLSVRRAVLNRPQFRPTLSQFQRILSEGSPALVQLAARNAAPDCLRWAMKEAETDMVAVVLAAASRISEAILTQALLDPRPAIAKAVVSHHAAGIAKLASSVGFKIRNAALRRDYLKLVGIDHLGADEVETALTDSAALVRRLVVHGRTSSLTSEQINRCVSDKSAEVREAMVKRPDFIPTPAQYRRLAKDTSETIRAVLKDRFLQTSAGIANRRAVQRQRLAAPDRKLTAILKEIKLHPTWTRRKYALRDQLNELLNRLGYVFFEERTYEYSAWNLGETSFVVLPLDKRGALRAMAGYRTHVVCLGSGDHGRRLYAAKAL